MTPHQELWIVWTARLAVALYLAALLAGARAHGKRTAPSPRHPVAEFLWTIAGITFVLHVGLAFQFLHHWSHESAFRHTAERTEQALGVPVGAGIYVNYVFLLWWVVDLLLLWGAPGWRSRSYRITTHAFFAFILLNATVVFGPTWWRWASLPIAAGALAAWSLFRRAERVTDASIRPQSDEVKQQTEGPSGRRLNADA